MRGVGSTLRFPAYVRLIKELKAALRGTFSCLYAYRSLQGALILSFLGRWPSRTSLQRT